jgi:hypothetical protein
MDSHLSFSSLVYAMGYLVALAALPLLFSRTRRIRLEKALFVFAVIGLVASTAGLLVRGFLSWDLLRVYGAAQNARNGASPYVVPTFLYLPTSLPLFELFARVPFQTLQRIWLIANTAMLLALPVVSWFVLKESAPESAERIGPYPYAAAACTLVTVAALWGIEAGQMHLFTSLLILAALHLKFRGRPFLAGLSLAVATLKIGLMLPALTQFCDRRGRWAWVGLASGVALLLVLGTPLQQLRDRIHENQVNIATTSQPGGQDDMAFENRISDDLVSVGRWLYCLGMRDRSAIKLLEFGIVGILGLALAGASATRRLAADAALAAACTFGTFFLYHRVYDAVLLAPALIYCAAGARREESWSRAGFIASTVAVLAVMNMPRGPGFRRLALWSVDAGIGGRFVQVLILPYAMWCLFGVMAVLCFVPRSAGKVASGVDQ